MVLHRIPLDVFIRNYCSDIVQNNKAYQTALAEDRGFSYEDIEEVEGELCKVITISNKSIPIRDIIDNDEKNFTDLYPGEEALSAYRIYRENFKELYGEEALYYIKNQIQKKKEELEDYKELDLSDI